MFGVIEGEMRCVGRLWQTPRILTETPYKSNYSPTFAWGAVSRSAELLRFRSWRGSGN